MKMKKTILLPLTVLLLAGGCSRKKSSNSRLRTDTDSVAYILGMNVGMQLLKTDSTLNVSALCDGLRDAYRGTAKFSADEARTYFLRYVNYALPEKARAYEEQFLEDIVKANRSYARTASGVAYTVSDVGDQNLVPLSDRDTVAVRWLIRTADGTQIYSSYEQGDTLRTALGDVTRGVRESLKLIGKGGRIKAWMPSAAAYGPSGEPQLGIRPNATLYYEMELVDVDKYANRTRRGNLRR